LLIVTALRRRDSSVAAAAARGRAPTGGVRGHGARERPRVRDDAGASSRSAFGVMSTWRHAVGWVELAKPSFPALAMLPMLGFVPQPSLQGFLSRFRSLGWRAGFAAPPAFAGLAGAGWKPAVPVGVAGVVWLIVTALRRRDASGAAPAARGRAWAGGVSGHGALERLGMRDDAGASSRSRTYRPSTRIAEPSRPGAKAGLATSESGMNRLVHRQRWCDLRALPEHPDHHRSACAITPDSPTVTMRRWRRASRCSPPPASWGSFPTEATRRSTASPSRWQAELGN